MAARKWVCAATFRRMTRKRARWRGGFIQCRAIPQDHSRILFWRRLRKHGPGSGGNTEAGEPCGIRLCTIRNWICCLSAWVMADRGIREFAARVAETIYLLARL